MSGETKWTPGPRSVDVCQDGAVAVVRGADRVLVARFECDPNDREACEATVADAYLDAAGPDMYAALRPLANMGDLGIYTAICRALKPNERISFGRAVQAARAALAKADGRVP